MIYADTDLFLALIKSEDWLKKNAIDFVKKNKGDITTSVVTVVETLLICRRHGIDSEEIVGSIFEIAQVEGISSEEAMQVAHLIKNENVGVFDSFHAVLSRDMSIVSSDKVYDRIGKERIKLGPSRL